MIVTPPPFPPGARIHVGPLVEPFRGCQVFMKDGSLYGFKGLAGKLGPIGVHAALLLCLFGTAWSGFGTLKGTVMCPEVRVGRGGRETT